MTAPPADGIYYIHNVEFTNSFVDLANGSPNGAIASWRRFASTNMQWIVRNIGKDQITLESVAAPGYYASAPSYSKDVPVFSSLNPTIWTARHVGQDTYNIMVKDFEWYLDQEGLRVAILLEPPMSSEAKRQQWKFVRVTN